MARTKTYQHFCPVARSLEVIGEKWSLLIVRDLLRGPRRFTDLHQGLGKITAKWLTLRLRDLEAAGIVERDSEDGRREVWYRLTPRGRELAPVIGALNVWGVRHALREPQPGERISATSVVVSAVGFLASTRVTLPGPRRWEIAISTGERFAITFDGRRWTWEADADHLDGADVRLTTTPEAWARFYAAKGEARRAALEAMEVDAAPAAIDELLAAFDGVSPAVAR